MSDAQHILEASGHWTNDGSNTASVQSHDRRRGDVRQVLAPPGARLGLDRRPDDPVFGLGMAPVVRIELMS